MSVPVVTKGDIVEGLRRLGVGEGEHLMVHTSLKSFGHVEGGADTVIDALQDAVGPEGTVMMPTFSHAPDVFDVRETPSGTGLVTEVFRKRPGVVRSFHATHAYAAWGRLAEEFTRDHDKTSTFAPDSPLGKLIHAGGWVLSLGVGFRACTAAHVGETEARAPCFGYRKIPWKVRDPETGRVVAMMIDAFRRDRCPVGSNELLEEETRKRAEVRETKVGNSTLTLVKGLAVAEAARELRLHGRGKSRGCRDCDVKPHTLENRAGRGPGCFLYRKA